MTAINASGPAAPAARFDDHLRQHYARFTRDFWYAPTVWHWRGIEAAVLSDTVGPAMQRPILDLGCGDGRFLRTWHDGQLQAEVGFDLMPRNVRRAARSGSYAAALVADGTRLPFESERFGTVFSNSTIEHIPPIAPLLSEVRRVLRPGGQFIATVPNHNLTRFLVEGSPLTAAGLRPAAERWADRRNRLLHHVHLYDAPQWHDLLTAAGLEPVVLRPYLSRESVAMWETLRNLNLGVGDYRAYVALKYLGAGLDRAGANPLREQMRRLALDVVLPQVARWESAVREGACWLIVASRPAA